MQLYGVGQVIIFGIKTADLGGQFTRQHHDRPVNEVNAVPAP